MSISNILHLHIPLFILFWIFPFPKRTIIAISKQMRMKSIYKTIFLTALIFTAKPLHAQVKGMTKLNTFDIGYGQKFLHKDFYNQLNTFSNGQIFQPLTYLGFGGYSGFSRNKKSFYSGHIFYEQVIPQTIVIADSISGKITGFNLGFTLIGRDLLAKSERFDMLVGFGVNTGRLRMYKNELIRQKNPYFSPKISISPRARVGKVVISLNLDYELDISKPGWRGTLFANSNKINVNNLRQSGLHGFLTIGRFIGDSSKESYGKGKKKE